MIWNKGIVYPRKTKIKGRVEIQTIENLLILIN